MVLKEIKNLDRLARVRLTMAFLSQINTTFYRNSLYSTFCQYIAITKKAFSRIKQKRSIMILIGTIIFTLVLIGTPIFLIINAIKEDKEINHAKLKRLKPNTSITPQESVTV